MIIKKKEKKRKKKKKKKINIHDEYTHNTIRLKILRRSEWEKSYNLTPFDEVHFVTSFHIINSLHEALGGLCSVIVILSGIYLTFTTLWAFSADDKSMIFFLIFPRQQDLTLGDNLHEMSNPVFWEK